MPITIDDVVTEIDDDGSDNAGEAKPSQTQLAEVARQAAELVCENDDLVERIVELVLQRLRERGQVD